MGQATVRERLSGLMLELSPEISQETVHVDLGELTISDLLCVVFEVLFPLFLFLLFLAL